jgi:NAD(P)H-nitrite reductase large subunit
MKHVIIIGNGIAGVTAARYLRKLTDYSITIISAESKHFFSRTALMYVYMGHMRFQDIKPYEDGFWAKNRINLVQAYVNKIDTQAKKIFLSTGKDMVYDSLILATGSVFNSFNWPGQDLQGVGGLVSLQDLDYMETYTKSISRGVVVGGGLIGIEMVEMLLSRNIPATFLVREDSYWDKVLPPEESQMVNRHIRAHHVDLRLATEMKEIIGDKSGRACGVHTGKGEEIPCQWVGITTGVKPNLSVVRDSGVDASRGILVNEFFETNADGVYAIGDCAEFHQPLPGRTKLEQVWYTGKMHGETVAHTIAGKRTVYNPGPWFNSAKFFDIEYQVYGDVPAVQSPEADTLYWEHTSGTKSIRVNWRKDNRQVTGFNLMGIRYRHKVCEKWILDKCTIDHVMAHLSAANCDPEFFTRHEGEVVAKFNQQTGSSVKMKSDSQLSSIKFIS